MKLSKNSGPETNLTNFKTASVWIRFMAMVYETILLVGPIFFSILVCSLLKAYISNDNSEGTLHPVFVQLLVFFLTAGYFTWGWSNNRVTLPMKTLNLRIVSRSGGSVTVGGAFLRFLIAVPSVLTGVWLISAFFRNDGLCPQDIISKTTLVQVTNESTS